MVYGVDDDVYSPAVLGLGDHGSPNPHRIRSMDRWSIPAGQLEASFARAAVLQREIERKERLLGRRVQTLAKGLADLMVPGKSLYRRSIGVHAFPVDGVPCLAAAYLEEEGEGYRYRYAVLCGGDAAKRAPKTADLDPGTLARVPTDPAVVQRAHIVRMRDPLGVTRAAKCRGPRRVRATQTLVGSASEAVGIGLAEISAPARCCNSRDVPQASPCRLIHELGTQAMPSSDVPGITGEATA